jgi:hypothetical protein
MGLLVLLLIPIALIGAAAILGLGATWLFYGVTIRGYDPAILPVVVAVGIPVVGVLAVALSQSETFANILGAFIRTVWMWALGAFAVGVIIGWADRKGSGRP